jgi:hypothetical protein
MLPADLLCQIHRFRAAAVRRLGQLFAVREVFVAVADNRLFADSGLKRFTVKYG